jgi:hypothetical protein
MTKAQFIDLIERSVWTFIQSFAGVFIATGVLDSTSLDTVALKAAAIAAAIAAVKAVIAQQFGNGTAATVPVQDEAVFPRDDFGDE